MSAAFSLITPALLVAITAMWVVCGLMHTKSPGRNLMLLVGLLAAAISLVPVRGVSLAGLMLSVNPVFSIGSLAGALMFAMSMAGWKIFLTLTEVAVFTYFGIAFPALLYASYLGLIGPDIYAMGFGFSVWFVFVGAAGTGLLLSGSGLGFIPLAALAAFNLRLLNSDNLFDYLVDFPLMLGCIAYVLRTKFIRRKPRY